VSEQVELVWYGDDAPLYDLGPQHPLRPARVILTRRLILDYGLIDGQRVAEIPARDATDDELLLVHTARYLDAVRRAGNGEEGDWWRYGFGSGDNPIFPLMHEASARVAGASVTAAAAVWSGRAEHAFNPAGGLHHAMPERASGFCVYDDPAVAIAWLLGNGASRIAYVDVDVHHGDGPQAIFYRDPRVLTVSLHQDGRTLFPGTGFVPDFGAGDAEGTKVNVPLPPYTGDVAWLMAFREVVLPLVANWRPEVLVTQLGCDTHYTDPLAHLALSTSAYRQVARELHALAHDAAGGRWVATGGGGYQLAGVELPDELPVSWIEAAEREAGYEVPATLSEPAPPDPGANPAVDQVVAKVKHVIFPRHGLAPQASS
jgi:acetoin utilization protein AcuC